MQSYDFQKEKPSRSSEENKFRRFLRKYKGIFRASKFAAGSAIGFLDTEIILVLGTYLLYGKVTAPQSANSSPAFWALNAIAFAIGVTVAFFVNEMLMPRSTLESFPRPGPWNTIQRLVKFQLIFLTGNVIIIIVQLLLLREFGISPYFGNIIGAIVAFPASYFFSMHFVWNSKVSQPFRTLVLNKHVPEIQLGPSAMVDYKRRIVRQFPHFINENFNIEVHEYKLDVMDRDRNTILIDFSLNLDVIPTKINNSKELGTVDLGKNSSN